jgi:hypothetical protein
MTRQWPARAARRRSRRRITLAPAGAALTCGSVAPAASASASPRIGPGTFLRPGNLLVSGSYHDVNPDVLVPGVTALSGWRPRAAGPPSEPRKRPYNGHPR